MNILIDTHILIRREYDRAIERHLQDVIRLINDLNFRIFVHPLSVAEVEKDKNIPNKSILLSKIKTYSALETQSNPYDDGTFHELIGKPKNAHDRVDSYLLYCLYKKEVDYFLTEDPDIVEKAEKINISGRVKNLQEASTFFKKTLEAKKTKGDDGPELWFYKKGGRWHIGEKGRESIFDDLKGFGLIHYLLGYENEQIKSTVLCNYGKISGDEDPHGETSKREIADLGLQPEGLIHKKRPSSKDMVILKLSIDSGIERLRDEFDSSVFPSPEDEMIKREELDEKIEKLKKYYKQQSNTRPDRDSSPESEKARINVLRLVKRALSEIANDKTTARYLNDHTIKTGDSCVYRPIEGDKPFWILFPESDNQ